MIQVGIGDPRMCRKKSRPRQIPSTVEERVRKAGSHLGTEWAMLLGARAADWDKWHKELKAAPPLLALFAAENARTELVLLHARVIYKFLESDEVHCGEDDVLAVDFIETEPATGRDNVAEWRKVVEEGIVSSLDRHEMKRLNKRLMHLSYRRADLPPGWDPDRLIHDLKVAFETWWKLLSSITKVQLLKRMHADKGIAILLDTEMDLS